MALPVLPGKAAATVEHGTFNLNKFKAEVEARLAFAKESTNSDWNALQSSKYMKDRVDRVEKRLGSKTPNVLNGLAGSNSSFDIDAAYNRIQKLSNEMKSLDSTDFGLSAKKRENDVIRSHSSDRMKWVQPEKWYSLSEHSAQWSSEIKSHRDQHDRPLQATKPTESPYSLPPARLNRFSDVSPNPRLVDNAPKRRHRSPSNSTASVKSLSNNASFGLMRKCHDPFNEGWKLKTFRPAREKLVPYEATVIKYVKDRGFGYLECQGQEVFVHRNDILHPDGLKPGQTVYCEIAGQGRHGLQARNVRIADGSQIKPDGMDIEEFRDHLMRRKHEEFVRSLFQTGFWKYPTTEETLPKEDGGNGLNFHPFVQDEKFAHRANSKSGETVNRSQKVELVDNGPDLNVKMLRKPWLKDGKIMPYLIKSPSRHPLQVLRVPALLDALSLTHYFCRGQDVLPITLHPSYHLWTRQQKGDNTRHLLSYHRIHTKRRSINKWRSPIAPERTTSSIIINS